jgi:hypothetical protein
MSAGHGTVSVEPIPLDWVPVELRMPNSEFNILIKFPGRDRIRVLRKNEACPEINENDD